MRRGDIGLDDERPLVTLGGRRLLWATQYMTRGELMDLLPQRQEEGTEDRAFDVVLVGLTPAAAVFFPARDLRLTHLPFRVGRRPVFGEAQPIEMNDLQLSDTMPFNVSRDHFAIERVPDGVQVRDRGSHVGTIVNGVHIGGHHHVATAPLAVGENEVVVGSPMSPFRFRVVVALRQPSSCPDQELHSAYRD